MGDEVENRVLLIKEACKLREVAKQTDCKHCRMYVDMTEEIEYQEAIITQQRIELIVGNLHQHLVAKHGYCRLHGMSSERE